MLAQNSIKKPNRNLIPKGGLTHSLLYQSVGCWSNAISSVFILASKDFNELLAVTTLWLSFNADVSIDRMILFLMEKSLVLLCYLLSAVPSPLMLVKKFLQIFLLADSPAVKNDSLCLKSLSNNSWYISYPESV